MNARGQRDWPASPAVAPDRLDDESVDAAIAAVLRAEGAAAEAVSDCTRAAAAQVQAARERSRRIAEQAAVRSARIHAAVQACLERDLAALDAQRRAAERHASAPVDPGRVQAAAAALADALLAATPATDEVPR